MSPGERLSLAIEPVLDRVPLMPLYDWVQRDPVYRDSLRPAPMEVPGPAAAAVLTGVFEPDSAVGLLRLVRTWLELQRAHARVHVQVGAGAVTVELDGQFRPDSATAELIRQAVADCRAR